MASWAISTISFVYFINRSQVAYSESVNGGLVDILLTSHLYLSVDIFLLLSSK